MLGRIQLQWAAYKEYPVFAWLKHIYIALNAVFVESARGSVCEERLALIILLWRGCVT